MKNNHYSLMIIAICIFLFLAGGCDTDNMLSNTDIPKPNEGTQNEQSSGTISEQEGADASESGGIIVDESNNEEEVIYEEPFLRVDDAGFSMNWCIQDGEIKDLEYFVFSEEIVPGNKYSKYDISWAYVDETLYLGSVGGWYYTSKIIGSEDKILLRFNSIGLALDAPHFKVFDTSTREVISIYPDYFEEDYYIESVYVSPDLENIIFLSGTDVYYYHDRQIEKLEQFEGKLEKLNQMVVTMAEGKILLQGDTIDLSEIYCYIYDIATDELTEQKYTQY